LWNGSSEENIYVKDAIKASAFVPTIWKPFNDMHDKLIFFFMVHENCKNVGSLHVLGAIISIQRLH